MSSFFPSRSWGRRDFLRIGATATVGLAAAQHAARLSAASETKGAAKNCLVVWLAGGPATIDMWDLKPAAPAHVRGDFQPIDTAVPGLSVCEHLPKIARLTDRCTLVRSLSHTLADHAPGTEFVATGRVPTAALTYPSFSALAGKLLTAQAGVAPFMALGDTVPGSSGFLGAACNPLQVKPNDLSAQGKLSVPVELPENFTPEDLTRRAALLARLDAQFAALDDGKLGRELSTLESQAVDILRSNKIRAALDPAAEPRAVAERYGFGWPGRALSAARRLITAGVRVVTVTIGSWDTHSNGFAQLRTTMLPQLDQALAALIGDLDAAGLLDETIIYCAGEFGRTPIVNSQAGRDHWPRAMSVLLAGGPLPRGTIYGATDALGMEPASDACTPSEINATLLAALGVSPSTSLMTPSGRPIAVMGDAAPLAGLLGG